MLRHRLCSLSLLLGLSLLMMSCDTRPIDERYLVYLPEAYDAQETWPLMVFLHGAGERGTDLERVKIHGPMKLAHEGQTFPFIIIAPQCPEDTWWELDFLDEVLADALQKYRVDERRIYVTGLSMGGFGTWAWAIRHPDRFAAIAPICGGGEPEDVAALQVVPTWVFHGAQDTVIPLSRSEEMVTALEAAGGQVQLTVYPEAGHDSWTETYNNPALYDWFLSHQR